MISSAKFTLPGVGNSNTRNRHSSLPCEGGVEEMKTNSHVNTHQAETSNTLTAHPCPAGPEGVPSLPRHPAHGRRLYGITSELTQAMLTQPRPKLTLLATADVIYFSKFLSGCYQIRVTASHSVSHVLRRNMCESKGKGLSKHLMEPIVCINVPMSHGSAW